MARGRGRTATRPPRRLPGPDIARPGGSRGPRPHANPALAPRAYFASIRARTTSAAWQSESPAVNRMTNTSASRHGLSAGRPRAANSERRPPSSKERRARPASACTGRPSGTPPRDTHRLVWDRASRLALQRHRPNLARMFRVDPVYRAAQPATPSDIRQRYLAGTRTKPPSHDRTLRRTGRPKRSHEGNRSRPRFCGSEDASRCTFPGDKPAGVPFRTVVRLP